MVRARTSVGYPRLKPRRFFTVKAVWCHRTGLYWIFQTTRRLRSYVSWLSLEDAGALVFCQHVASPWKIKINSSLGKSGDALGIHSGKHCTNGWVGGTSPENNNKHIVVELCEKKDNTYRQLQLLSPQNNFHTKKQSAEWKGTRGSYKYMKTNKIRH